MHFYFIYLTPKECFDCFKSYIRTTWKQILSKNQCIQMRIRESTKCFLSLSAVCMYSLPFN